MERRYEAGWLYALSLTGTEGGQSEFEFRQDEERNQDIFNCKEYSGGVGADDAVYFKLVRGLEEDDPTGGGLAKVSVHFDGGQPTNVIVEGVLNGSDIGAPRT